MSPGRERARKNEKEIVKKTPCKVRQVVTSCRFHSVRVKSRAMEMHSNSIAISSSSSSERNSITDLLIQLPHARQALLNYCLRTASVQTSSTKRQRRTKEEKRIPERGAERGKLLAKQVLLGEERGEN